MTEEKGISPIALYYDEACSQLIPQRSVGGKRMWYLNFGRVDAGSVKITKFYVRNLSEGVIENMEVELSPPDKSGVEAELLSRVEVRAIAPGGVHEVQVRWSASNVVKAGECSGSLLIKGMLTVETLYFPT